jgi:hypothetical protein
MKSKILLFAMLMFAGILSSQAQGQGGQRRTPEERAKMSVDRAADSITLSATQKTDLEPIYLEYYKAQDKLREGLAPGTRPERADMDKLTEARDAKLKVLLKEEQFTRLKALEAARGNRGGGGGQRPPGQ